VFGAARFEFETDSADWEWTDPIEVELGPGLAAVRIRSLGPAPLDVEGIRVERACPGPCQGDKLKACLDKHFDRRTRRSAAVIQVEGSAGHATREADACGAEGYYFVGKRDSTKPGRIVAEVEVPRTGTYLFRFQYRLEVRGRSEASLQVVVGGRVFEFQDAQLLNTNTFEWSPELEVSLDTGRQTIEFRSIGRDSVHLEKVALERVCGCGGGRRGEP
jgi:hypothetical protein